MNETEKII